MKLWLRLQGAYLRLQDSVRRKIEWVRFGEITEIVRSVECGGIVSEVEYRGRGGKTVGYWAYGHFDPSFPYRG